MRSTALANGAWVLNAVGLLVTLIAALILWWYPPLFAPPYTEGGEGKLTVIVPATPEGKQYAEEWKQRAWWGPVLLVVGFAFQFVAGVVSAPFMPWAQRAANGGGR